MILSYIKSLFLSSLILFSIIDFNAQIDSTFITDSVDQIIPVFTTTVDLLENEQQSQDISGYFNLLEMYMNQAGFNFSAARYRLRGYSSENTRLFLNGIR